MNWTETQINAVFDYLKTKARPSDKKVMHYCWRDVDKICGVTERYSRTFEIFFILVDRGQLRQEYVDDGFNTTELYLA